MAGTRGFRILGACLLAALSSGCDDEPAAPRDTAPPAAVTDLLATQPTATSIELHWTAPGDDGSSGRAAQYDVRQLNGTITDANWAAAVPVDAEIGSPKQAGETEVLVVGNLAAGQEYFFALRTSDEAANWSPLSNVTVLSTFDLEQPDAITDLAIQEVGDFSVKLAWTATGDDGSAGRAAAYDIRWSELPITEDNWSLAHVVSDPLAPALAGFEEVFEVTGLERLTSYSFAVRAEDETHNVGGLSNVVQATTTFVPQDPADLVRKLQVCYSRQDYALYETLFPGDADAAFLFYLYQQLPDETTHWGRTEELRLHRRMFEPQNVPPGEAPVPVEYWLTGVLISLSPLGAWTERPDLYQSPGNPAGLDPARWRATGAQYHADLLLDTQSETDFRVDGQESFVVIDDLTRAAGENGKFLLYRWEDLGAIGRMLGVEDKTWSQLKNLYR